MHQLYQFRPLDSDECRIIFIRHGKTNSEQVLTASSILLLRLIGEALAILRIIISKMISSPQPRAVRSGVEILAGAGQDPLISTEPLLNDMTLDPDFDMSAHKAAARKMGIDPEQRLLTDPSFAQRMEQRGWEGRAALMDIAKQNLGGNVLVPCHSGAKMEVTLLSLIGSNTYTMRQEVVHGTHPHVHMFRHCEMAEVIIGPKGIVGFSYLTAEDLDIDPTKQP